MSSVMLRRLLKISGPFPASTFNNYYSHNRHRCLSTINDTNIVHSSLEDVKLLGLTIPEYVFQDFSKYPDKIALECGLTGKKYNFEELRKKSKNFGKTLRKKFKLNRGDVVALILPNVPDFAVSLLGALDAGLVVSTVNPTYTPDEVRKQLIDSNAKLVITLGQLWPLAQAAVNQLPNHIPTITIKMTQSETLPNGTINFQECIDTEYDIDDIKNVDCDALAMLPYSSGTTGLPKGVELSTNNIVANLTQLRNPYVRLCELTTDNYQDVVLGILPWFHVYGIVAIMLHHLGELCQLISLPKFSLENFLHALSNQRATLLYLVPPLVVLINNNSLFKKEHLQTIHTLCSGAAPLGALDEEKIRKKAGKQIYVGQGYGLTESTCIATLLSPTVKGNLKVSASVGIPLGNTSIKIVPADNASGEALGPNQCGELFLRGPQITKGYHNRPQETQTAFLDGWFRTGDLGYYDKNNFFYITDRLKELIKVKGYQVAPAELEQIIRDYPGVLDAAVIGVPHEKYGEVPRAYIIPKKDYNINTKMLELHVASKVAEFKHLKGGVTLIENIPKTASGKILRKQLKLLYESEENQKQG